jgi:hypothetical protein
VITYSFKVVYVFDKRMVRGWSERLRMGRVTGSYPSALKMRWLALMSTLMLNWPSALVMAPCRVFFTETVTFERGVCAVESRTIPVIVLVCPKPAWDRSPATRKRII